MLLDLLNHLIWTGLQVADVSPFFTVNPDLSNFGLISQCLIPISLRLWLWRRVSRHFYYFWCYRFFIGCMTGSCFVLLPGPCLIFLWFVFWLFLCFRHFPLSEFMFIAVFFIFSLMIVSWLFFDVLFLVFFIPCLIFNKQSLVLRILHIKIFFLFIILLILLLFFLWFILLYFKYFVSKIVVFSQQ